MVCFGSALQHIILEIKQWPWGESADFNYMVFTSATHGLCGNCSHVHTNLLRVKRAISPRLFTQYKCKAKSQHNNMFFCLFFCLFVCVIWSPVHWSTAKHTTVLILSDWTVYFLTVLLHVKSLKWETGLPETGTEKTVFYITKCVKETLQRHKVCYTIKLMTSLFRAPEDNFCFTS